jgi:hypothetical protein
MGGEIAVVLVLLSFVSFVLKLGSDDATFISAFLRLACAVARGWS